MRYLIALVILFNLQCCSYAKENSYSIVTSDVTHFWEAVDNLKPGCDTTAIFQQLVVDRASNEFKLFIRNWNIKASDYAKQLQCFPKFYTTLRQNTLKLIQMQDSMRSLVERFRQLYPGFNDADFCIAVGNFSTGGTVTISGGKAYVYIGLEFHAPDNTTDISEMRPDMKDYLSRSNFFRTVIHELVHIQQQTHGHKVKRAYYDNQLLNHALREGVPDFVAHLIYPYGTEGNHTIYGTEHELKLRSVFKSEMNGGDNGKWFSMDIKQSGMPHDLGYFMGAQIAKSYYDKHPEAHTNLTDIIEIKDADSFIEQSGYFM